MSESICPACYDPYDLWATKIGVYAKYHFYRGHLRGKVLSVFIGLLDWLLPAFSRVLFGCKKTLYPITVSQWILTQDTFVNEAVVLQQLLDVSSDRYSEFGRAWGLGFSWMSKNGLYDKNMPFVTHTPYAIEALNKLSCIGKDERVKNSAAKELDETWSFLSSLRVMYENSEQLALSYAPVVEPRIVVNANSYAALCYALHAQRNSPHREHALQRCTKLCQWVVAQQQNNGSWYYYSDSEPGNFIDGFHSCFILKNLVKVGQLLPDLSMLFASSIQKGVDYLENEFVDKNSGLLKRFAERDIKDPFTLDLYDQAEYLGVLLLLQRFDDAQALVEKIRNSFYKNGHWYCRRDILGRYWGKEFLRWGIMPFFHFEHELKTKQAQEKR